MHVGQLAHGTPSGCKLGHRMPPSASSTPREIVKIKTQRRLSTTKERERERERERSRAKFNPTNNHLGGSTGRASVFDHSRTVLCGEQ